MNQNLLQRICIDFNSDGNRIAFLEGLLPSGSGIDCGMKIDFERSKTLKGENYPSKIVLLGNYHYMDENGFYSGWFDFQLTIKPCLVHGFGMDITFKGDNSTPLSKREIEDLFGDYLCETVDWELTRHREFQMVEGELTDLNLMGTK